MEKLHVLANFLANGTAGSGCYGIGHRDVRTHRGVCPVGAAEPWSVLNTTTAAADCRPTGTMPAAIPSSATVPGHAGAAPSFIRPWGRSRAGCGSAGEACCISARATARIIRRRLQWLGR